MTVLPFANNCELPKCETCKGSGRIDTCTHVEGSGKSYPCPACDGTGRQKPEQGKLNKCTINASSHTLGDPILCGVVATDHNNVTIDTFPARQKPIMQDVSKFLHPTTCPHCGKTREITYPYSDCGCEKSKANGQKPEQEKMAIDKVKLLHDAELKNDTDKHYNLEDRAASWLVIANVCKLLGFSYSRTKKEIPLFQLVDFIATRVYLCEQQAKEIETKIAKLNEQEENSITLRGEIERLKSVMKSILPIPPDTGESEVQWVYHIIIEALKGE